MRRLFVLIATALIAPLILAAAIPSRWLAAVAQEPVSPLPRPETRPEREPLPTPPPHVIVMRSDQGDVRILRRGGWIRRERVVNGFSSIHMTGSGGYNYRVVISAQGAPVSMELNRADAEAAEGARTGATDTVLGEHCEIWASEPAFSERVPGGPVLTCVAADGIALWSGRGPPGADAPRIYSRAVTVERRTPAWSEFSFPREALDWSYWSSRFAFPPETVRPAYEIRYGEHIIRVRGDTRYEGRPNGFSIRGPDIRLHYTAPEARSASFSISTGPQQPSPHPLTGGSEPMNRAPLRISGESCDWHRVDLTVRWGVVGVCVTDDGIQFAESTDFHDEALQDRFNVATYFRRGAWDAALMLPPENVFEPWIAALPN